MGARVRNRLVVAAIAVAGAASVLATVTAPAHAEDKKPAPRPQPKPLLFPHVIDVSSPVLLEAPSSLVGRLHVVVETTFAADGQVAERRLHANLMNAFVTSLDGSSRMPANGGGSEARPAQACTETGCPSDVWSVQFGTPKGAFTLRLVTRYDAEGALVDASVVREIVG